jgi:hypothetical protein
MPAAGVVDTSVLRGHGEETYLAKSVAGSADVTLTFDEMTAGTLDFTGALTGNISVIFPLIAEQAGKRWHLRNATSGPFSLTVKVTSQAGLVLERGQTRSIAFDGADMVTPVLERLPRRFELTWIAGARGKPGINADIQDASEAVRMIADPDFEILGSGASSDDVTFHPEGGVKIETDGGGTNAVIVLPHLDANQSAWTQVTWGTDQQTAWEGEILTGSAITAQVIHAGLKLTNTPTVATDDNQLFFRYEAGVNGGRWQFIYSIAGVDVTVDTGVTVVLSSRYHLRVAIDASRIARAYINGLLVATSTALTTAIDLIPYIGILEAAAAAKHMYLYGQAIGRVFA